MTVDIELEALEEGTFPFASGIVLPVAYVAAWRQSLAVPFDAAVPREELLLVALARRQSQSEGRGQCMCRSQNQVCACVVVLRPREGQCRSKSRTCRSWLVHLRCHSSAMSFSCSLRHESMRAL